MPPPTTKPVQKTVCKNLISVLSTRELSSLRLPLPKGLDIGSIQTGRSRCQVPTTYLFYKYVVSAIVYLLENTGRLQEHSYCQLGDFGAKSCGVEPHLC
jgi:hypothetical protein